uniref:Hemolysin activation/secretion protein n=1 Tax=Candidatus Kentrum sp. DK TaxID=2126562 RepID=A0A450SMW9_9GAMM|nr:MAG: Hemolysin activation/secretion protein [Candidatus Kentron sp. DK]
MKRFCLLLLLSLLGWRPVFAAEPWQLPSADTLLHGIAGEGSVDAIRVKRFTFEGNTVITDEELAAEAAPYTRRAINLRDLEALRMQLTRLYRQRGFIGSGALIPDQQIGDDGRLRIVLVEGKLGTVAINGLDRLNRGYLLPVFQKMRDSPLNMGDLEVTLRSLESNPRLKKLRGKIRPTGTLGVADLDLKAEENAAGYLHWHFNNHRPPSVGAEQAGISFGTHNLSGRGDALALKLGHSDGGSSYSAAYSYPFQGALGDIGFHYSRQSAVLVETPFDVLDIEGKTEEFGLRLTRHGLFKAGRRHHLSLAFQHRRSASSLLGQDFSFAPGVRNGKSRVSVLRLEYRLSLRHKDWGMAMGNTLSWGLDTLGATVNQNAPDGRFVSWAGALEMVRKLGRNTDLVGRVTAQISPDPLLPLEKFPVGGVNGVRGYRENHLVRDNGVKASLEVGRRFNDGKARLLGFVDWGRAWNSEDYSPSGEEIASVGLGLEWRLNRHLNGRFYWAHALRDRPEGNEDLQDRGIHFSVGGAVF